MRWLLLLVFTACGSTGPSTTGPECGRSVFLDRINTGTREIEDRREYEEICYAPFGCEGGKTAYFVDETCAFELENGSGAVVQGSFCKRSYTSAAGGTVEETLIATGGASSKDAQGVRTVTIEWDRRTKASSGDQTTGRSTWTLTLKSEPMRGLPGGSRSLCGQRGQFEMDDGREDVGCLASEIVDRSASTAMRVVEFGGAVGDAYTPKCMRIAAGQSVTWRGPFSSYVLSPGLPNASAAGTQPNPITFRPVGTEASFTFDAPGDYLFHCSSQPAADMRGLIRVR